jgi:succinate dehydrogenase / fumarate reductase, cytochrome b subunit
MLRETTTMADAKGGAARPLSPHIQVYKPLINMVMSIIHRITGAALYFGTLLLAWWLLAAAQGEKSYATFNLVLGHPIGKFVLFGYTWALIHHMLGGIRHLYWDTGRGFAVASINRLSWLTVIGSITLTLAVWGVGLLLRGSFS